jgi:hypothetical protein
LQKPIAIWAFLLNKLRVLRWYSPDSMVA